MGEWFADEEEEEADGEDSAMEELEEVERRAEGKSKADRDEARGKELD